MNGILRALGLALVFAHPLVRAQYGWIGQQYTTRNGLPQNSVIALAMDSVGFLWITTESGLIRCDGERFLRVPVSRNGANGPERMRRLIPSLEKDLYVDDSRGRMYLIHGYRAVFPVPCGPTGGTAITGGVPGIDILIKLLDRQHPLEGRDRWPTGQLNVLPMGAHDWCVQGERALFVYRDSTLVDSVALPEGCSRLFLGAGKVFGVSRSGEAFRVDLSSGRTRPVLAVGPDGGSMLFPGTGRNLFWRAGDASACLQHGRALYLLSATERGDSLMTNRLELDLPTGCRITAVLVSKEHRIVAVGTDTKGLFIHHPRYMRTVVHASDDSTSNSFYAQAALPDGGVMAADYRDLTVRFNAKGEEILPSPIPVFSYEGVFRDGDGSIWHSPKQGLKRFDPFSGEGAWVIPAGDRNCFTRFLREGDSLWTTDQSGIHCWRDGELRRVHTNVGNEGFRRAQFLRRRDAESLWFGTCDGLYALRTASGQVDTIDDLRGRCVRAMEHIDGRWFVGTYGSGAFVEHDGGFRKLPMDERGYLAHVHAFMPDAAGNLWMSTNQGLFRMNRRDIGAVLTDTTFLPHQDYFGEWSGIENSEFNGGCDPAYVRLTDGTASFPTLGGLVWFIPESIPDMRPSAPVLIEEVVVDGKVWPVDQYMVFDAATRAIEVGFSLPYWGDQDNVHLEYWLKGRPGGWGPLDAGKRELRFRDLPPGEYELLLRRTGSADPAAMGQVWFNIRRPIYQRPWARVLLALATVFAVWALVRLNAARLRGKNRRLEERVRTRTRALEEANRELQRSMELKHRLVSIISHDIVTPLQFIARVARSGARPDAPRDAEELADTLRDISFSADKLYTNARNTLSWIRNQEGGLELRPMHVALNPLVEEIFDVGRALAQSKGSTLSNEVSMDDVLRADRDVLSIILHNLITNAITHTGRGEVRVSGEQVEGAYAITVADTGHGMSQQALAYIRSLRAGDTGARGTPNEEGVHGLGYVIILELVRLLGARIDVTSSREAGTRVTVRLPVEEGGHVH